MASLQWVTAVGMKSLQVAECVTFRKLSTPDAHRYVGLGVRPV
jgi:hypothetical protein